MLFRSPISITSIAGLSSVMLVMLMGQPRIFFAMAQDGLFFKRLAEVHPRYGTPALAIVTRRAVSVARPSLARTGPPEAAAAVPSTLRPRPKHLAPR